MSNKIKQQVRASIEWRELRAKIAHMFNNKDALSNKPLRKGWQLHHLDMSVERYAELKPHKFVPLNQLSHKIVHAVYKYWKKDKDYLKRLKKILEEMEKYDY